jgi:glycosyltransferase involved in cell wall biosynthesis
MSVIDLIFLTGGVRVPVWEPGRVVLVARGAGPLAAAVEQLAKSSSAQAVLFWDDSLGAPSPALAHTLLESPGDGWHAGLRLGMGGLPGILDFVSPAWMLSCDPPANIIATSWRLSLSACLVRMEVLRKLGGPRPEFKTLEAAALELGHRWIRRGALLRHVPNLVPQDAGASATHDLPFADEVRFAYYRCGRKWAAWAVFRAVVTRATNLSTAIRSWRAVMSGPRPAEPPPLRSIGVEVSMPDAPPCVSVLIPTVDRYPYLRTLLGQLRKQTVRPLEIIIVDQTAAGAREGNLAEDFRDLPIKLVFQDAPGQCSSRNAALQMARGDYILFIDDDDEVPPDLIELHLRTLRQFQAGVSSGVAEEVGAGPLPADFRFLRASDVFPTNNTMMRREILRRSGLLDLAYNHRPRADGDLGMRIYLTGACMVLNPAISVLHHHAPAGGLRKHKARTVTYAMSRTSLFHRALAGASEIYLAGRYWPRRHAREMLWQSVLGTFSLRGNRLRRLAKMVVSGALLPLTMWELRSKMATAKEMTRQFPQIPMLEPAPDSSINGGRAGESGAGANALQNLAVARPPP